MLKRREVKTYQVELICDECGTPMKFTGIVYTSYPGQYEHRCPKCGNVKCPECSYPRIEYECVEEDGV